MSKECEAAKRLARSPGTRGHRRQTSADGSTDNSSDGVGADNDDVIDPKVWANFHGIHTAAPASAWESVFARVTHCATGGDDWLATLPQFRRGQEHPEARAVVATVIDGEALPYDPPAVPRDVMRMVSGFHSRPEVWWVGALARYLLRPAKEEASSDNGDQNEDDRRSLRAARLGLQPGKYIGMHVRRTDKIETTLNTRDEWPAEAARAWRIRAGGRVLARGDDDDVGEWEESDDGDKGDASEIDD